MTMDPAAYARFYGVQSESNKVTVTRVAGGELLYRREVDGYKRDMEESVTNIRDEQKKLRQNMREYRDVLKDSKHINKNRQKWKPLKKASSINELVKEPPLTQRDLHHNTNDQEWFNLGRVSAPPDIEHSSVRRVSLPGVDRKPIRSMLYLTDKKGKDVDDASTDDEQLATKDSLRQSVQRGSKRFKEVSFAQNVLDYDDDESSSTLSDRPEKKNGKGLVVHKSGKHSKPSAHLKPVSSRDKLPGGNGRKSCKSCRTAGKKYYGEKINTESASLDSTRQDAILSPIKESESNEDRFLFLRRETTDPGVLQRKRRIQKKKSLGVSFRDLLKFERGANTQQLFNLVDRLAEQNGLTSVVTPAKEVKPQIISGGPWENVPLQRRSISSDPEPRPISSATTHGSVYYTMQYGYVSDTEDSVVKSESRRGSKSVREYSSSKHPDTSFSTDLPFLTANGNQKHTLLSPGRHSPVQPNSARTNGDHTRKGRLTSILNASRFVSNAKNNSRSAGTSTGSSNEDYAKREMDIVRKKNPNKPDNLSTMHQQMAKESVAWSSALGQIKLIHSLDPMYLNERAMSASKSGST